MTKPKGVQEASEKAFDVVIVPRGSVDPKYVVGTVEPEQEAIRFSPGWYRRVQTAWKSPGEKLVAMRKPLALGLRPKPGAGEEVLTGQALGQLAETLKLLAETRKSFRSELQAAIDEGEALLSAAS